MDTPTISDAHSEMMKLEAGLGDPKTDWSTHLILVGGTHLQITCIVLCVVTPTKRCCCGMYRANGWFPSQS